MTLQDIEWLPDHKWNKDSRSENRTEATGFDVKCRFSPLAQNMLCYFRNMKEKYGRGRQTQGIKTKTDRTLVKELLRTGWRVCSRSIVYKENYSCGRAK